MRIIYVFAAILIFGILIAVHELGHFLAAKGSGVRVNEFSIGMGPAIWHRQKGETQYSLRILPIGGYCAMEGEEGESDDPAALNNQGFWKQLLIFAAGSIMNLLTGILIILILYTNATAFRTAEISGFAPEFQLQGQDGLQVGDTITQINDEHIYLFSDLDLLWNLNKGDTMNLVVEREGQTVELSDIPLQVAEYTGTNGEAYQGYGIYFGKLVEATPMVKLQYTWRNTVDFVRLVRVSLKMLVTGQAGMDDISGPVGIVSTISEVGQSSPGIRAAFDNILYFAALIAVNLAVMNMLPLPALDGGHIFFLVIGVIAQKVFRRKIKPQFEAYVNMAGFAILMGFMLLVTFYDVSELFR